MAAVRKVGASHVLLGSNGKFTEEVRSLTGGTGVQAVFDAVGRATFEDSVESLVAHGTLVSFETARGPTAPVQIERIPRSIFLTYSVVMNHVPDAASLRAASAELFQWVSERKLNVKIDTVYPLADASCAHRDLGGRSTSGKLLLRVEHG